MIYIFGNSLTKNKKQSSKCKIRILIRILIYDHIDFSSICYDIYNVLSYMWVFFLIKCIKCNNIIVSSSCGRIGKP